MRGEGTEREKQAKEKAKVTAEEESEQGKVF